MREISPAEISELCPIINTNDVLSGFYVPTDGRVNPYDATLALAKGARNYGAQIFEHTPVDDVVVGKNSNDSDIVTGVKLSSGQTINATHVVNAAGMWARQFASKHNVSIPNQANEHYYVITEKMAEVDKDWPVVEDPSSYTYIRPEGDGLMLGLFEKTGAAWNSEAIPSTLSPFCEIEPDLHRMLPYIETAMNRAPAAMNVGMKKIFCGPESFTPDNGPAIGESLELENYFVAAGLNSIGILTGGGIGRIVASWIKEGKPDVDVTGINTTRFHRYQSNELYRYVS